MYVHVVQQYVRVYIQVTSLRVFKIKSLKRFFYVVEAAKKFKLMQ